MLFRVGILLLLTTGTVVADRMWEIREAEWTRPRHGSWLVEQPALVAAVKRLQQVPLGRLQIQYPGGDKGWVWAEELRAWMVALGVESSSIDLLPGSGENDLVKIMVIDGSSE